MNWHDILHLDSIDAVDPCNHRFRVLTEKFYVLWQAVNEDRKLSIVHCFDQEALVVREKEK
jgi:hypothetical protein